MPQLKPEHRAAEQALAGVDGAQARELLSMRGFAARWWSVPTKSGGRTAFVLNRPQRLVDGVAQCQWDECGYLRMNVLKCRQMGDTTYWSHDLLRRCMFRDATTGLILADKRETPAVWLARCAYNAERTPLSPGVDTSQVGHQIGLKNGSRLYIGSAQGGFPGVGDTVHYLLLSELCWWDKPPISKNPDEVLHPLEPAVPSGADMPGSVVVRDSTGVMRGDWWSLRWEEGKAKGSEYRNVFVPWFLMETYRRDDLASDVLSLSEYEQSLVRAAAAYDVSLDHAQIAWRRGVLRTVFHGDDDECAAAYPATEDEAFMSPGLPVYKPHHVRAARETVREPVWCGNILGDGAPSLASFDPSDAGELWVWEWPDERYHYALGADCQWGKHRDADWDVLHVECLETGRLCAKVRGHYPLNLWGWKIAATGHKYNTCPVAPEVSGQEAGSAGGVMGVLLGNVGAWRYPRIYVRTDDQSLKGHRPQDYGWDTNHWTKGQLIADSQQRTLEGCYDWCDGGAVDQMATVIKPEDGNPRSPEGMHDDDWMSRMITAYVSKRERGRTELWREPEPVVYHFTDMSERVKAMAAADEEQD